MEDSCPATPLVLAGRDSKSPLQVALSSPESDGMKSPSRDSPDSRCVICLGRLQNKSFTDSCLHQFCFQCLLQWSKIKPECPLCKQPFKSIIHNVRSNLDYDQYHVEHGEPRYVLSDFMHSYNFDFVDRRFRYRSTMTREYFRELAESFLAHTRRLPEDTYQISPMVPVDPAPPHNVHRSNRLQASVLNLRSRQRGTSDFRRNIYAQDLWVQDLADISGRYRECTPQFYRENPAQIHRIIPWLNREVNVLLSDCESHAAYVLTRIISFLSQHSIRSREFRELVQPYFGDRTEHFIHELYTFARSVYDIAGFDQNAVYGTNPNYATEVQEISSSNEDSDIEVLETVKTAGKKSKKSARQGFKKILLKRAGDEASKSDEPVAGPSGINSAGPSEPIEICESDPDEIKVLDFVKPEPEVVTLSSGEDSPLLSGLDLSGGEYVETKPSKLGKNSPKEDESDEDYVVPSSKKRKDKSKMGKGKCKSTNGFGLKGKQKRKYIKSKKCRSSSTSSTSSTSSSSSSESTPSSSSSTTTTGSTGASSRSRSKSYSSKSRRSRSISFVSCSSCEYKSSRKIKNKKSKVSRKKYKNKINYKSSHKVSENLRRNSGSGSNSETGKTSTRKKKVKSCVIVPSSKSCDSSTTASRSTYSCESPRSSDDYDYRKESRSLASYWSIASSSPGVRQHRKKRENSSERKSAKHKRKFREHSSEERSTKRVRDSGSSSKSSCDVESVSSRKRLSCDYSKTSKKSRSDKSTISFNSENSNSENLSCGHACDIPSASTSSNSSNSSASKVSSTIFYVNSD